MSDIESSETQPSLGRYMPYPFADGDYHLALGLAPMRENTWLDFDEHYVREMREKARRLRDEYDSVFLALPGCERGQAETLELLLQHLIAFNPERFRISGRPVGFDMSGRIENLTNGERWDLADFADAPLDLAARLVQEDLCLMSPRGGDIYVLSAGSVCFPLRWELRDKIGLPLAAIHHPVPGYDGKLATPADLYLARLKPHRPSWRCNWNVVDSPDLYLKQSPHPHGIGGNITPEDAGIRLWIRSERQSLRKLPNSGDVLFTIRTYIRPLSVLEGFPALARGLSWALEKIPPEMREYKNQLAIREPLLAYLARIRR
jgi:heme-dependent oxidative N-demethylase alpha subunit-like protein